MKTKVTMWALMGLMVIGLAAPAAWANPWNGKVVLQSFWWECENERYQTDGDGTGGWYTYLAKLAPRFRAMGFDGIWVPPPCKAAGVRCPNGRGGMGYDLYDHYDLGQKYQRHKAARDQALPGSGLAIWHIDELGDNQNEQMTAARHYECSLEQGDGRHDLENDPKDYGRDRSLCGLRRHVRRGPATERAPRDRVVHGIGGTGLHI